MATPTTFPEANMTWKGPTADIGDLPAHRDGDLTISRWKLTDQEVEEVRETGTVWLHVWGVHPPVGITGESPFV